MNKKLGIKVVWLIGIGLVFGAGTATAGGSKNTKLDGTLVLDFLVPADTNPVIPAGFVFTVSKDKKGWTLYDQSVFSLPTKFPVPNEIRGGTFMLNAECSNPDDAGAAQLRVQGKKRGTVFKALVTSGAASCLPVGGATRTTAPFDDPFIVDYGDPLKNFLIVFHGERGLWLAQILESAESAAEAPNTLRTYFEIPVDQTVVEAKYKQSEVSPVPFNRGGSADGITNTHITLTFKQPPDNDDDSDSD